MKEQSQTQDRAEDQREDPKDAAKGDAKNSPQGDCPLCDVSEETLARLRAAGKKKEENK